MPATERGLWPGRADDDTLVGYYSCAGDEVIVWGPQGGSEFDRSSAAKEPAPEEDDIVRVPTSEETADSVARAQRTLAELQQRRDAEKAQATEETRAEELARRHADDRVLEQHAAIEREQEPVLEMAAHDD